MEIGSGLTLLVGGARSGKSDLAVGLGTAWGGPVVFAATGEPIDDDMAARIDRHKLDRPDGWATVERPRLNGADVEQIAADALLIVDCLTVLVSNLMLAEQPVEAHAEVLAQALADRPGPTIVVSNEVGMGVHPETALGRSYRDQLGRVNRIVAERAQTALLIVAGRAIPLESVSW
ncbi:MAG: bifunctional adenosylcobinamide kinase/adenosylcobinamide-phosphate guanylyltransferase [Acidimicrobiales bacterium]